MSGIGSSPNFGGGLQETENDVSTETGVIYFGVMVILQDEKAI